MYWTLINSLFCFLKIDFLSIWNFRSCILLDVKIFNLIWVFGFIYVIVGTGGSDFLVGSLWWDSNIILLSQPYQTKSTMSGWRNRRKFWKSANFWILEGYGNADSHWHLGKWFYLSDKLYGLEILYRFKKQEGFWVGTTGVTHCVDPFLLCISSLFLMRRICILVS